MPLNPTETLMYAEAGEAGARVADQFARNAETVAKLAERLRALNPRLVVTCARGSSDHAALFGKYVFETMLGVVTSSAAPSVSSIYAKSQAMDGVLFLAVSQSGKSPDLLHHAEMAKAAGAFVVALVNVEDSPLARLADWVVPLHAGPEKSVAATKSFICSQTAILHIAAAWSGDADLKAALEKLPAALTQAAGLDWSPALETFIPARNFFVIGRGPGFGIANEAALKFKETSGLHAEAFSAAEVKHGPMALVGQDFPLLCFAQEDETQAGVDALVDEFRGRGAVVWYASPSAVGRQALPVLSVGHPAVTPVLEIQSFYRFINALSVARGYNPDVPPHLNKVTETV